VNKTVVSIRGHMEIGFKEESMHNFNYVSAKGDVEFFDKILLQKKRKGVESDFFRKP
jgi:hypothetical protein